MEKCEKCPRCQAERHRYVRRVRARWVTIAVTCECCGYEGPEKAMKHDRDENAALQAAIEWNWIAVEGQNPPPKRILH